MNKKIIQVRELSKNFVSFKKGEGLKASIKDFFQREKVLKEAVKKVSFDIEEGEFVGFLGPNGAGKTTTLKMLTGILTPTSGEAEVLGFTPWKRKLAFKKQFSLVMGQKNQLWWDLPPLDSYELFRHMYEIPYDEYKKSLHFLTDLLDIGASLETQTRKLSLGERMKAELIGALLHKPKVLFLDEPTIGLDVVSQKAIREFLKDYNRETKATIILTSHYMEDIKRLCPRVLIIHEGIILYDGDTSMLNKKFAQNKAIDVNFSRSVN
ncbi:MAG: ABC transporter ATP-binding protein, partial [Patescibacteria group bacterium]